MPATVWHMEDKPLWFLDIILVCLFGAVEEIILVLSHELLRTPMLHNIYIMLNCLI